MTDTERTKIQFPCAGYHISVVADTTDGFVSQLEAIILKHCANYDSDSLKVTASKNGRYQSFRFSITAYGEAQLTALHEDLMATGHVHMVL